jgi:hypothetical protein
MGFTSEKISCVRAMKLACGVRGDGSFEALPKTALVRWRSGWGDKLHQVYVNGSFAGETSDCEQRRMIVHLPDATGPAVRVEVFAIEQSDAGVDFSEQLNGFVADSGRVRLRILRSQHLPLGGTVEIYYDSGTGQIDYSERLNAEPILIWPSRADKAGFGMSRFGFSDFGRDWAAGACFGAGVFGQGQFGVDADVIEWVSGPLADGEYKFAVRVFDEKGNAGSGCETDSVLVIRPAMPTVGLDVASFDKETNQLVLSIS